MNQTQQLRTNASILWGSFIFCWVACPVSHGADLFVAMNGRDAWSGTLASPNDAKTDGPFATLGRARDAIRKLRADKTAGAHGVQVRGGNYELGETLALTAQDSGTVESPVVWRNYAEEQVTLSGGRRLSGLQPVTDKSVLERLPEVARDKVKQVELKSAGVSDFGQVAIDGQRLELFLAGRPMQLARWPNADFVRMAEVIGPPFTIHGLSGVKEGKFTTEEDRLARWTQEPELWMSGYWFWDWSDARQRVKSIDAKSRTIELELPHHHYGYRKGQRYFVLNALSELDVPGEWYLDRQQGMLYFWPPSPSEQQPGADAASNDSLMPTVTVLPTLISLQDAAWITVRGMILENARAAAVTVNGGEGVRVGGCVLRNTGTWGVTVIGGKNHGVIGCEISETGEGGILLSGGDRTSLTPAGHFAENNHIHHYARLVRTYQPAIGLQGVGQRAAHNHIHDAPHVAILLSGNEHLIEFNDIHHVCNETGDVGAFYMGRDWSMRGNLLRHNYFHHLSGPGLHGAMAVYLDDAASGTTIFGNIFYQAGRAAFVGGGRDNIIDNNIFVECKPSVHVDSRGLGWMSETAAPGGFMHKQLAAVPYQQPPWSTKYPQLVKILDENPAAPQGNKVLRNISVNSVWLALDGGAKAGTLLENNLVDQDPGFKDAAKLDFRLQENSPAFALGFKSIPVERIGLVSDEWRASLPKVK
jgi:hypothetical protein